MKTIFPFIPGIVLIIWSLVFPPEPTIKPKIPARTAVVTVNDSTRATQTTLLFLNWYKKNIHATSQIILVNQQAGKPYSVNLKNGERYLAYLRSSNLLTDQYLDEWRTFFKERNEGFRLNPQTEGPPTGFDYDLVMLNQDVDMQLASLKSLRIKRVKVMKTHATVTFDLFDIYEFRLVRGTNRWLIDEILNLSQE